MLKSESIQFCDGLSTQGNWWAAASGCHQPVLKQPPHLQQLGLLVCARCALRTLFACGCLPWTNAKVKKSIEGYPNISSLICLNLSLCCPGEVPSQLVGITLSHTRRLDTMLIYYSIIRVIGCAHGLLPSGCIYK
jgi:hypothetical protein